MWSIDASLDLVILEASSQALRADDLERQPLDRDDERVAVGHHALQRSDILALETPPPTAVRDWKSPLRAGDLDGVCSLDSYLLLREVYKT